MRTKQKTETWLNRWDKKCCELFQVFEFKSQKGTLPGVFDPHFLSLFGEGQLPGNEKFKKDPTHDSILNIVHFYHTLYRPYN